MKLIEKIIDYIFGDYLHLLTVCGFVVVSLTFCMVFAETAYEKKLQTDIKLAKIAAGQMVDEVYIK